jgi:large repetitive protein
VGTAYSATLAASGGIAPYTWSVATGTLPQGLAMTAAGVISGTPLAGGAGSSNLSFKVTDSGKATALSATASLALNVTAAPAIVFGSASLADATSNTAYVAAVSASGGAGPLTYSISAGALPAGLSISTAGAISGTPTATGSFSITVQAADVFGDSAAQVFALKVGSSSTLSVTPLTPPTGYVGSTYAATTLAATGGSGTGYTWAVSSGSSLPAGLTLSAGVIGGKPTAAGTSTTSVTVTDSASNTATASLSFTIKAGITIITATTLPDGSANNAYLQAMNSIGGSGTGYTWALSSGSSLPTGLVLSTNGAISGKPTATGTSTFSVTVTDSASNTATASFTLTIKAAGALIITTPATLPSGYAGDAYSQTLNATGGTGTGYAWTVTAGSTLSAGLRLSTAGVLSGSLPAASTPSFNITVTDSASNTANVTFSLTITDGIRFATSLTLPSTYIGVSYVNVIRARGGSGTGYVFSVTSGSTLPPGINLSNAGTVSGTPTTADPFTFNITVTDSANNTTNATFSLTVDPGVSITSPTTLPAASVGTAYAQTLTASGGTGSGYIWTVLPGSTLATFGLSLSSGGVLSGTPTKTGTATFTVSVTDTSLTHSTATFNVAVNPAGATFQVSGQISLANQCGTLSVPQITVSISTTPVQTTTTDGSGNYSFASIPAGTYTITPSITGASSVFYPATLTSVVVNNNPVIGENFTAEVGYTVSGTVAYSASGTPQTGQTYISVIGGCNTGNGGPGTSISETTLTSGGAYTIRGVPPGSYTVQAWMDPLGQSVQNAIDPTDSASLTVTDADVSGIAVTLHDPTFATPTTNPALQGIIPNAQGVLIEFNPSKNSNSVEDANQYEVQWSTSPTLGGGTGGAQFACTESGGTCPSHIFTASGDRGVWVLTNALLSGSGFSFTSGQTYYFQARSFNTLDTANTHPAGWCNYTATGCSGTTGFTGVTIDTPACTGTCTTVSSSVTIPAAITIKPGAPLYLGLLQFSSSSGGNPTGIYVTEVASPSSGANDFTVTVPSGSNYAVLGILDQNNTGGFGAGAITNVRDNIQANLTISGSTQTVAGITLPTTNSTATVSTQFSSSSCQGCGSPSTGYQLSFNLRESDKLPVAVVLNSGPNLPNNNGVVALDMSLCSGCSNPQFGYSVSLLGTPNVGDTYGFTVTYSDGTQDTGTTVTGAVTGWNGGSSVVDASDAPSGLAPNDNISTSTTPTFTWTDSANSMGTNFYYSFYIYDQSVSCSGNCWQIPGNNSKSNGFSSSITSITWGTDPTGGGSTPTVGSLTSGDVYNWSIQVQDSNRNSAQTSVWYQP